MRVEGKDGGRIEFRSLVHMSKGNRERSATDRGHGFGQLHALTTVLGMEF